jgi:apolipoprotein N-acyltransferase
LAGAALFGGVLAFAGDYPSPIPVLHWLAPIPALVVGLRSRPRDAFWVGALYGLVATGRIWLDFDVAPLAGRAAMAAAFAVLHGLVLGLTVLLAGRRRPALTPWVFAACVVVGEAVCELPSTGHWWTLAATQVEVGWLRATASLGGSYLVTFLVSLASAAVASLVVSPGRRSLGAAMLVAGVIAGFVAGARLLPVGTGRDVRVAAVSVTPPADVAARWYDEHEMASADLWSVFDRYAAATRRAADAGAEVVGWREFGLGVPSSQRARLDERVRSLARETGAVVVAGFVDADARRNFALLAAPDGGRDLYAKRHLVPMAETRWLEPGEREYGWIEYADLRIAVRICYDLDFPRGVRDAARRGANLLVAPSADWPGIHERHPLQAALRAIENGLPIVRPAQGLSTLIDARGAVVAQGLDSGVDEVVLVGDVALRAGRTLYTATGNWLVAVSVAGLVTWSAALWLRRGSGRGGPIVSSDRSSPSSLPLPPSARG